ncbi:hypothetical protein [Arcobacter roscoffensis]|uniref:DUF2860 domain-containing protein n=1 Tax=Arcobacter roscoffensis TaxID=2961520 RepID=A0ABY5E220_9BACT|nr:hypothetical protein [Arcobacter roscoffensis]UTJ05781.1 hypothetical protein NJU99_11015 [Arcobacter roscoffensis]
MKKKILLSILTASTLSYANQIDNKTFLDDFIENTNDFRETIHSSIINTSIKVDNYFFEDTVDNLDYHNAYGLLEFSASQNQHESIVLDQRVKIKLKLPRLKEAIHLEIETDEQRDTIDNVENKTSNSKNDDVSLALGYYKTLRNKINLKTKVGLKIKSKLDPFIKIEAKRTFENPNSNYIYTLSQAFKYSNLNDLESTSYFKIDRPLNETLSAHNFYQHYLQSQKKNDSEFYSSIYLDQKLTNKDYIRYTANTNINNIDSDMKVKRYALKLKYRHFIKKWLYLDTVPENYYSREQDFKPRYAIRFNLGMYFNKDSY